MSTQPDREQRFREIVALDGAFRSSAHIDQHTGAGLEGEAQPLARFHVGHHALELLETLLEGRQLLRRVCREAFVPGLGQVGMAYTANEMEDQLLVAGRSENCV